MMYLPIIVEIWIH